MQMPGLECCRKRTLLACSKVARMGMIIFLFYASCTIISCVLLLSSLFSRALQNLLCRAAHLVTRHSAVIGGLRHNLTFEPGASDISDDEETNQYSDTD